MSRRTSHAPSPHLHHSGRTFVHGPGGADTAISEAQVQLTYAELCKLHDVGRDWTDTKKKVERVDKTATRPTPDMGLVCPDCFVQVPRGVFSCDVCGN